MDIRNINEVFVPKNCARTNGSDTLDAVTVTGVQIWNPLADAGTAATTYFGPGELVITDVSGRVLDATTALKSVDQIEIRQRDFSGTYQTRSHAISGKDITSYVVRPYAATVQCQSEIVTITPSLLDYVYTIRVEFQPTTARLDDNFPLTQVVSIRSSAAGNTSSQLADMFVAEFNSIFSAADSGYKLVAIKNTAATGIVVKALPMEWGLEKFPYNTINFELHPLTFTATPVTNFKKVANTTINAISVAPAAEGTGIYELVAEAEWFAQGYKGFNRDMLNTARVRSVVPLSAQKFEDDGSTANRYDEVVINWEYNDNHTLTGTNQRGHVSIFLPVDGRATNQQADIIAILDKYIVTEYGVGTVQVGNLT